MIRWMDTGSLEELRSGARLFFGKFASEKMAND